MFEGIWDLLFTGILWNFRLRFWCLVDDGMFEKSLFSSLILIDGFFSIILEILFWVLRLFLFGSGRLFELLMKLQEWVGKKQ